MLSVTSSNRSGVNAVSHLTNAFGPMAFFRAAAGGGGGSGGGGIAGPVATEEELADAGPAATRELDEGPVATRECKGGGTSLEPELRFEESLEATAGRTSCSLRSPGQPKHQTLYRILPARLAPIPLRKLPRSRKIMPPSSRLRPPI